MKRNTLIAVSALLAVIVTAKFVEAQFTPPTSAPPTGSPTVIHNIALNATPQTASVNVSGGIRTNGCMGSTFAGYTASQSFPVGGLANGYKSADDLCAAAVAGSHVCRVEEAMESIKCDVPITVGTGWVNGGPPGYNADANDCGGWKSNSSSFLGRIWFYDDGTSGGSGALTPCNANLPFICCK